MGIMLLVDDENSGADHYSGALSVGALTDNLGNRFVLTRMMTTKWPRLALLVKTPTQLEKKKIFFEMCWAPREQNAEADAITNGDVGGFSADKELQVKLDFLVVDKLLDLGDKFYTDVEEEKKAALHPEKGGVNSNKGWKKKKAAGLKVTDPW